MKLRSTQQCPLHPRTQSCACRNGGHKKSPSQVSKKLLAKGAYFVEPGVLQVPVDWHPRGFVHRRTPAAMRRLLDQKIKEQGGHCAPVERGGCGRPFTDYSEIAPDHIDPRGAFGAFRDDHPENIQAMHSWENNEKGSKRL